MNYVEKHNINETEIEDIVIPKESIKSKDIQKQTSSKNNLTVEKKLTEDQGKIVFENNKDDNNRELSNKSITHIKINDENVPIIILSSPEIQRPVVLMLNTGVDINTTLK